MKRFSQRLYRNLLAHGALYPAGLFMLAFYPEPFYLWRTVLHNSDDPEPDYKFSVAKELPEAGDITGNQKDDARAAEQSVMQWLSKIAVNSPVDQLSSQDWLVESGLAEVLKSGRIVEQPCTAAGR
jgi:hypothetical protein